jgi:hypothetical protein
MKILVYLTIPLLLSACHPAEFGILEIKATDAISGFASNNLTCSITENGNIIASGEIKNGLTKVAYDSRSNKSYNVEITDNNNEAFYLTNNPSFGLKPGESVTHEIIISRMGTLDFGLNALNNMSSATDFLEYQIVPLNSFNSLNKVISKGWNYGDPDIYGAIHNDHYIQYEIPAGKYRVDWRKRIGNSSSGGSEEFNVVGKDTTNFILNY